MRIPFGARTVLALTLALTAWAGEPAYAPIPAEVWNLKEADSQGTGAIILARRMTFTNDFFEFYYQIRILNEAGKEATSVFLLPERAEEIWGRTVTHGGDILKVDPKKDLMVKTLVQVSGGKVDQQVLVPPGLNADCVVEVHWREPQVFGGLGGTWRYDLGTSTIPLAMAFPIREETVTIPEVFRYAWDVKTGPNKPEMSGKSTKVLTLKNLPAVQFLPFALEVTRDLPVLILYPVPGIMRGYLNKDEQAFWAAAGKEYYQGIFSHVSEGRAYREWAATELKDLPASPQAAAIELAMRLDAGIRNTSVPTFQEVAAVNREGAKESLHAWDLDETVAKGRTNGTGMMLLYVQLLQDAHLAPKVIFVADRNRRLLDRSLRDVTQYTDFLVGVPESGKPDLWVDPTMRFAEPGLIDARYQGTPALSYDLATWKHVFITVPVQAARSNVRRYDCRLEIGEEADHSTVDAAFTGYPERQERLRYMALEPAAQMKLLKENLEARDSGLQVGKTEVLHATDPRKNLAWHAEASKEREPGRRLAVDPFPMVPWPLTVPKTWAPERKDAIIMPHLSILLATATFKVPPGYRLLPSVPVDAKTLFGKVHWVQTQTETQDGPVGKVTLRVDLETLVAGADQYGALKDFTSAVREAMTRLVLLEKP